MKINPSVWPINNRTAIYVVTVLLALMGYQAYNNLPKEQFPEVKMPQIIVQTIYPGTSPTNMENLVSKPLEKKLNGLTGIKKVTSNSFQDFSIITAEFNTDVDVDEAKLDVQDAVDKAGPDLPNNLPNEPEVKEIDVSEMPIMFVNIYGDYDVNRLEKYADKVKDKIEDLKEIKRVDKVGGLEREIQINVDLFKLSAAQLSFRDIQNAVSYENVEATPGEVKVDGEQRLISIKKTFESADEIGNLIVKTPMGAPIFIKDIAEVKDTYEDAESFARLDGRNVITLNIIKASGKNLINASDKIHDIIDDMKANELPDGLSVITTAEQAEGTKVTLHDLINTIIIGFCLVTLILMFFMGATNALFVALSVPLSMAIAFMFLPTIDFTLNMIVLFSFLLALGIVVDDAIVVIENAHRIFHEEDLPIKEAVIKATGEVFVPVLAGTVTTLLPFIPLAFWGGVMGKFMFFLPITLIITLLASLVVAYIINPVFAVDFMKRDDNTSKPTWTKRTTITTVIFVVLGIVCHLAGMHIAGNLLLFVLFLILLNKFVLTKAIHKFQTKAWPKVQNAYVSFLTRALNYRWVTLAGVIAIIIFSVVLVSVRSPKVEFFPSGDPKFTYVYLTMPEGTDQNKTNEVLKQLEERVYKATKYDKSGRKKHELITSIVSNVKVGATDVNAGEMGEYSNRGKITVSYVEFADRHGKSTQDVLNTIREACKGVAGARVTVEKESSGPPTPKPIVIEITGENLDSLINTSTKLKRYLDNKQIGGVEELKSDFQANKPEIVFNIQRSRLNNEGISTGQVAGDLRTAMFGSEVSRFKDDKDDYPIILRLQRDQRNNIDIVKNLPITYRDMGMGGVVRQVPLGSFATLDYGNTYGGIKRKDEQRIITLSSNVLTTEGYNANEVVAEIQEEIDEFIVPTGVNIKMAGEQEDQMETMLFLRNALIISMMLIFLILLLQFNSLSRSLIIMSAILLSIIGVLLGNGIFNMPFVIVMTGIGIVALAGIVVRNGILLVEFADLKLDEGLSPKEAILEAGRTRMTPVLLTAASTIMGLIPLAVGLNIDFASLFETGNPKIFFGGDSVAFWGPLSWTMIFGLGFATIITLIIVPTLMLMALNRKKKVLKALGKEGAKL